MTGPPRPVLPNSDADVHVIAPGGIDDPANPTGGNIYDRRMCDGLRAAGWAVREHLVGATWPEPDARDVEQLRGILDDLPDGAAAIVDGLIASASPDAMRAAAGRVRLAVLVHLPFGVLDPAARPGEAAMLQAAAAVIATSGWTRDWLVRSYGLAPARIAVAEPGVDPAPLSRPSAHGNRLLCVAAIVPNKGQDVLIEALRGLADLEWSCVFAGAVDRDPEFAASLRAAAESAGIAQRLSFVGALSRAGIAGAYGDADLVVSPSRHETFGMVITEALACGLPVLAADAGGTRAAMGAAPDGQLPGWLAPREDPAAISAVLRAWLTDSSVRERARRAAADRRGQMPGWEACAASVGRALIRLRAL